MIDDQCRERHLRFYELETELRLERVAKGRALVLFLGFERQHHVVPAAQACLIDDEPIDARAVGAVNHRGELTHGDAARLDVARIDANATFRRRVAMTRLGGWAGAAAGRSAQPWTALAIDT